MFKKFIDWLVAHKDIFTTISGVIAGIYQLSVFIIDFLNTGNPEFITLITGLFAMVIGWFTGKKK